MLETQLEISGLKSASAESSFRSVLKRTCEYLIKHSIRKTIFIKCHLVW